ncbi:MAG: hypothetical protein U0166_15705 [Acidobacteriota bacterium]
MQLILLIVVLENGEKLIILHVTSGLMLMNARSEFSVLAVLLDLAQGQSRELASAPGVQF